MAAEIEQHIADEARLIDDLLEYDRAGRGLLSVDCRRCDLHDVARRALRVAAPAFRAKAMPVTEAFAADAPIAWADPIRARQIVFNLLRNAVTFAPVGSPVVVQTRNPAPDRIELAVVDAGYGIVPEQLPGSSSRSCAPVPGQIPARGWGWGWRSAGGSRSCRVAP